MQPYRVQVFKSIVNQETKKSEMVPDYIGLLIELGQENDYTQVGESRCDFSYPVGYIVGPTGKVDTLSCPYFRVLNTQEGGSLNL